MESVERSLEVRFFLVAEAECGVVRAKALEVREDAFDSVVLGGACEVRAEFLVDGL